MQGRRRWPSKLARVRNSQNRLAYANFHFACVGCASLQVQLFRSRSTVSEHHSTSAWSRFRRGAGRSRFTGAANYVGDRAIHRYVAGQGELPGMTVKGRAYIAGIFEHPTRLAPDKTVAQLHAEVALGALGDAGLH